MLAQWTHYHIILPHHMVDTPSTVSVIHTDTPCPCGGSHELNRNLFLSQMTENGQYYFEHFTKERALNAWRLLHTCFTLDLDFNRATCRSLMANRRRCIQQGRHRKDRESQCLCRCLSFSTPPWTVIFPQQRGKKGLMDTQWKRLIANGLGLHRVH